MKFILTLLVVLTVTLSFNGCAGKSNFSKQLETMYGANKQTIVTRYGIPNRKMKVDESTEIWEYELNKRSYTSNTGYRYNTYTFLRITLKDNRMENWSWKNVVQ